MTRAMTSGGSRPALITAGIACLALASCARSGPVASGSSRSAAGRSHRGPRGHLAVDELEVRKIAGLGRVLVDGQGFALYVYLPDHEGPSRCHGECAAEWPPLELVGDTTDPTAGPGVSPSLLGSVARPGEKRQVTYDGRPLYLYRDDHEPGEVTGQGDDMGLWFVVRPDGSVDRRPLADE